MTNLDSKASANAENISNIIQIIDERIAVLIELIKESQPKRPGAITLHLYPCGKGCNGCPHPVWLQWYSRKSRLQGGHNMFLSKKVDNPLRRLKRSGDFEENYLETRDLVFEAVSILSDKSKLVQALNTFNLTATAYSIKYGLVEEQEEPSLNEQAV